MYIALSFEAESGRQGNAKFLFTESDFENPRLAQRHFMTTGSEVIKYKVIQESKRKKKPRNRGNEKKNKWEEM
jgi:hypothetical protein